MPKHHWSYQTFVKGAEVQRLNERKCPCRRSLEQIALGRPFVHQGAPEAVPY
jgi:hypothetical protein